MLFYKFSNYSIYFIKIDVIYKLNMKIILNWIDRFKKKNIHLKKLLLIVKKQVKIRKLCNILYKKTKNINIC